MVRIKMPLGREQLFHGHEKAPCLTRHPHFLLQHAYKRYSTFKAVVHVFTRHQNYAASVEGVQSPYTKAVERYEQAARPSGLSFQLTMKGIQVLSVGGSLPPLCLYEIDLSVKYEAPINLLSTVAKWFSGGHSANLKDPLQELFEGISPGLCGHVTNTDKLGLQFVQQG